MRSLKTPPRSIALDDPEQARASCRNDRDPAQVRVLRIPEPHSDRVPPRCFKQSLEPVEVVLRTLAWDRCWLVADLRPADERRDGRCSGGGSLDGLVVPSLIGSPRGRGRPYDTSLGQEPGWRGWGSRNGQNRPHRSKLDEKHCGSSCVRARLTSFGGSVPGRCFEGRMLASASRESRPFQDGDTATLKAW